MTYLIVCNDPISSETAALEYAKTYNPSDVFWIKKVPDKKEITVDVINTMIDQMDLMAVGSKKLFIVFQAELLNVVAQNKLLKTIENANDDTTVLFLCQNLTNILPTIKSRSIIRYQKVTENLTIKQLADTNPDTQLIRQSTQQLFSANNFDQALTCLPVLAKPENLPLALDTLSKTLLTTDLTPQKKMKIYQALANIKRNILANCNHQNTFDLLLLAMFQ